MSSSIIFILLGLAAHICALPVQVSPWLLPGDGADEEELGEEEEELLRIAIAMSLQDLNHTETEPDVDEDSMNTSTVESKEGRSGAENSLDNVL
ncbi:hypothetical protein EOD39_9891 [Acipenser ruthenus]|uniref:Uncharacterized protein n=1 Tax=Acipenser ruthenus TaxID=7906 RepID=A0A662YUX8_ACIRT|nr:hypothetical protein EOD39_9891 [Acipenser ruthenus]